MDLKIQDAMPYQVIPAICIAVINSIAGLLSNSPDLLLILGILGGQVAIGIGSYFLIPYLMAVMNDDLSRKFAFVQSDRGQRFAGRTIFLYRVLLLALFESFWTLNLVSGGVMFRTRQEIEKLFAKSHQPIVLALIIAGAGIAAVAHFYTARSTLNKV